MNNTYDFGSGPGGPMISGKWMNKKTGEVINVRDCLMDGDNMILSTSKGMMDFTSFSNNYIQASDEVYDTSGKVIKTEAPKVEEIIEDNTINKKPTFTSTISSTNNDTKLNNEPKLNNFDLIDKIFKKIESKPKANLKIEWADFPKQELSMLVNYFDVKTDDIATYIGKYLINEDFLQEALSNFLNSKMKETK